MSEACVDSWPLGIMRACLDVVLPLVCQRKQFGRPLGEFQFILVYTVYWQSQLFLMFSR